MKEVILSENPLIRAYNMDCMEFMRDKGENEYDLAIVDPPYGLGLGFSAGHKQARGGHKASGHDMKSWNEKYPSIEYFKLLTAISNIHIIWGANYYGKAQCLFGDGRIIHNKMVTPFIASTYSHADIAATNAQHRITMFDFQWSGNVQNGKMNIRGVDSVEEGQEKRIHPTQKPVQLYRWLLQNYAKEGDRILDTHGGSFSSAIACHKEGYNLDIIEIDEEYFEAGVKRFKLNTVQESLF